ncbi:hypothetical protein [Parvicella tangerina]|uniref:Uncharacterized protein n=1 Tax=Parvicella tangerina TaxID=2829795 RepID=A0A916NDP4_9FLAO|nr:hypothetical protein [Parvicella tangerina]CAG5087145.1 hypothetical protein CRYO30217_03399 [Parvicella tangerina]
MIKCIKITIIIGVLTGMAFLSSCLKPISYPDEPELQSVTYTKLGDSLMLSMEFTDGDGDVGLNEGDTASPYEPGSFFHYNLYVEYFEMMDGEWVKGRLDPSGNNFPTADTINFQYRIKNLTPIGQNKTLKGTINITIEAPYYNPISNHNDSIKYRVSLIDRSLNISNLMETELITR